MASHRNHNEPDDDGEQHREEHPSPSHIAMTGHDFSAEDLQSLLFGVLADDDRPLVASTLVSNPGYLRNSSPANSSITGGVGIPSATPTITDPQEENGCANDLATARTERKRKLEKQRRSDVNKQFTQLQTVLRMLETEAPNEVAGLASYSPANRVDLISRTVQLLQKLHDTHKKQRLQISDLQEQLACAKQAGEEAAAKLKESIMAPHAVGHNKVMMMVPMLIGGDANNSSASVAMPMMQPWMPPTGAAPSSYSAAAAPQQQQQQPMAWMMPSAAHMAHMPWMMHPSMHPMMATSASPVGAAEQKDKSSSSDGNSPTGAASKNQMGGNLAHCA